MHGESCLSVLIDGAQHNVHDGLAFELNERLEVDNVLRKKQGAVTPNPRVHKMQSYLTEFDQSIFKIKVKEDGVEHAWSSLPDELLGHQAHLAWVEPLAK